MSIAGRLLFWRKKKLEEAVPPIPPLEGPAQKWMSTPLQWPRDPLHCGVHAWIDVLVIGEGFSVCEHCGGLRLQPAVFEVITGRKVETEAAVEPSIKFNDTSSPILFTNTTPSVAGLPSSTPPLILHGTTRASIPGMPQTAPTEPAPTPAPNERGA